MIATDIKFIDTSDWQVQFWLSSGGTRAKKILQDTNGNEYFFKCSEKKEAKDGKPAKEYKYEFWNEIIAYQLGKQLGLNMLRYDVAVHKDEIGCLSPKMNITEDVQLIEVGRYMTAINENFIPENNASRKEYTFQLLEETFNHFKLADYWEQVFQTLLFDAIIGNTDRHQENWAFLGETPSFVKHIDILDAEIKKIKKSHRLKDLPLPWYIRKILGWFIDLEAEDLTQTVKQTKLFYTNIKSFAPIYDSGSSLARELTDERVAQLLQDELALDKYISKKGMAELHWNKIKLTQFQLIENLVNSSYIETITHASAFLSKWDDSIISMIMNDLDRDLPAEWHEYRIPENRKQLIIKIVSLRIQKLKDLLSGGI